MIFTNLKKRENYREVLWFTPPFYIDFRDDEDSLLIFFIKVFKAKFQGIFQGTAHISVVPLRPIIRTRSPFLIDDGYIISIGMIIEEIMAVQ